MAYIKGNKILFSPNVNITRVGGNTTIQGVKYVQIKENGVLPINADSGYDGMVKVIATVNVPNESSWCGEYAEGTVYKTGAIVSYEGNVYLCIKDLDEMQDPTNTEYWEMLNEESGGTVEVIPDGYIKPSGTIDITENKTVDVTRYASAKINVPIPSGYVKPSGTLPITENGLHTVRKADGGYYDSVNVNVPSVEPTLITQEITENGTYIANNYNADGFSSVTVNVESSGGGGAELNIAYGDTAPEDTSKLWVKTTQPSAVKVASTIETVTTDNFDITLLKETLPSTMTAQSHIVGDKAYLCYGTTVYCYDFTNKVTETFSSVLPFAPTASAVVGEKIYLIPNKVTISNGAVSVYDTITNTVTTLAITTDYQHGPVAVVIGTLIYILGGGIYATDALTNRIQCFDTEAETLTTLDVSLPNTLRWANGIAIEDKIYIFGGNKDGIGSGIASGTLLNTIVCFDTTANTCSNLSATLPTATRYIACASIDNIVYLFGGGVKGTSMYGKKIDTICRFNPSNNEIAVLDITLPIALAEVAALSYCGEIFLFGGDSGVDAVTRTDTIYKFTNIATVLAENTMFVQSSDKGDKFNLINTDTAQVEIGVKAVYKGNADGIGEQVEASLHNGTSWVTI